MFEQILIGSLVIFGTVFIQAVCISGIDKSLHRFSHLVYGQHKFFKNTLILSFLVIGLVIGLTITCWLWAFVYMFLGVFNHFEESVYFSIVTFATLGYGDIVLDAQWRILSSLTALNGLILVGLNTAYLAQTFSDIRTRQST